MKRFHAHAGRLPILLAIFTLVSMSPALWANPLVERWFSKLDKAEDHLRGQEWDAAYWEAREVSREVLYQATGGTGLEKFLSRILVIQAIAEAGRNKQDSALWNWESSLQLYPAMEELALEKHDGEAGRLLRKVRARAASYCCKESSRPESSIGKTSKPSEDSSMAASAEGVARLESIRTIGDDIVAPRKLSSPKPQYPRGRRPHGGLLIVQMIIDKRGNVSRARVLTGLEEPLMVFSALNTLREWTFDPATLNGAPVNVYYNLTINFTR